MDRPAYVSALERDQHKSIELLIANGFRLSKMDDGNFIVTDEAREFEKGVLKCRRATLSLLAMKKKKKKWAHVDRSLVREIAFAIWCTRHNKTWTNTAIHHPSV